MILHFWPKYSLAGSVYFMAPINELSFKSFEEFICVLCLLQNQTLTETLTETPPEFLTHPVPTVLPRSSFGILNKYPVRQGKRFLLAARKRKRNKSSNYLITTDEKELVREGPGYCGKVRANFMGTEFVVYNSGVRPSKEDAGMQSQNLGFWTGLGLDLGFW